MLEGSGRQQDERCWRGHRGRSNIIGGAREAVNNTRNRAGRGVLEGLITTGASVLEEPEKLLTSGATQLDGHRGC